MIKIIIGLVVSIAFLYFTFKDIELNKLATEFINIDLFFVLPAIVLTFIGMYLRSVRWQIMLSPLKKTLQKDLLPMTLVGFMAIITFPIRSGEIVRPYLLSKKYNISLTSSMTVIFLERILDFTGLSIVMLLVLITVKLPPTIPLWIVSFIYSLLIAFSILIAILFFIYFKKERFLKIISPILKPLPKKVTSKILQLIELFIEGLHIIASLKRFLLSIALSLLIWSFAGLIPYATIYFHKLSLSYPLGASFVILFFTMAGISIPSAPGFLGNFQLPCIEALKLFESGISLETAAAFSISYYTFAILSTIIMGVISLRFVNFSIKEMLNKIKTTFKKE